VEKGLKGWGVVLVLIMGEIEIQHYGKKVL
jgi:hypothetical protein